MVIALLVIDYINEIVHPEGKLAAKGYAKFVQENNSLANVNKLISLARSQNHLVIHVKIGFSKDYKEQPKNSPLFAKVKEYGALQLNTWATEFHESIDIQAADSIIIKHRVNCFYSTQLKTVLNANQVTHLWVAGVATDLAVSSAVRDAHDRDYQITIFQDCCAAANHEDHENSLKLLSKLAKISTLED